MRKPLLLIICILVSSATIAQSNGQYIHRKLLRASSTLSVGFMPQHSVSNVYIHGDLEYYTSNKISIRGESYFFMNGLKGDRIFAYNHSTFTGINYHFPTRNKIDPYIGFQPGLAMSQKAIDTEELGSESYRNTIYSPLFSGLVGVNFYADKFFHVFANVRYVNGNLLSTYSSPVSLNEIRVSFGLGFNLF